MAIDWLKGIAAEPDVLYAVRTDVDGNSWVEAGDRRKVPHSGIVRQYFPGAEAMPKLAEFLRGQILPKTIIQGNVVCVICKPTERDIVGLFVANRGDALAKMRRGRELNQRVVSAMKA